MIILAYGGNGLVILLAEFNLLEVGFDTLLLDTLGDNGVATVGTPCNEDLSGSSVELLGNLNDLGVIGELGLVLHCTKK